MESQASTHTLDGKRHPIVLFDGQCGFCSRWVQWILRHDGRARFRFAALGSPVAKVCLERRGVQGESLPDSLVLIDPDGVHTKSGAALRIARGLAFPWSVLGLLGIVPASMRDVVYDWIARRRRTIGPVACLVPTEAERARFLTLPDATA